MKTFQNYVRIEQGKKLKITFKDIFRLILKKKNKKKIANFSY